VSAIIVDAAYRLSTMSDCQVNIYMYCLFLFVAAGYCRRLLPTAAAGE
jgi:hypothetical protein